MRIAIHGRKFGPDNKDYVMEVLNTLKDRGSEVFISPFFKRLCSAGKIAVEELKTYSLADVSTFDFFLSLGGDGTLLDTVTHIGTHEIPILGINLGRLGFLATTAKKDIQLALDQLVERDFTIEKRSLLSLGHNRSDFFDEQSFALNEIAIMKRDTSSMIVVNCYLDDKFLNSYWADGLMVSTPTGSTGYSLSCGGPVILPNSNTFSITPVSPHNLNVRPMIIPDSSVLRFEIRSDNRNFLVSLDSRSYKVDNTVKLEVKKERFFARLVMLNGQHFIETLRNKLNWGLDSRN